MQVTAIVNLKGGTGKTTSAAYLLHGLAQDRSVVGVDADDQGSLMRWAEMGDWSVPVIALPTKSLHRNLAGSLSNDAMVVIDTPPLEDHQGVVMSALRIADLVIVPCAPTPIEVERLPAVRDAVESAADLRPNGTAPQLVVLLTRTVASASSTQVYREAITADGIEVLPTEIRRLERYAQAYGDEITDVHRTSYADVSTYVNTYFRKVA